MLNNINRLVPIFLKSLKNFLTNAIWITGFSTNEENFSGKSDVICLPGHRIADELTRAGIEFETFGTYR